MSEPVWVYLNGWGSDKLLWMPLLTRLGGRAILLDLPELGGRNISLSDSWSNYVDELAALLPERCTLVGWSLGGMLAVQLAARAPAKVERLVTIAANARFVAEQDWPHALSAVTYEQFYQGFAAAPARTLGRFHALQAKGDKHAKEVLHALKQQPAPNAAQTKVWQQLLQWLVQVDNRRTLARLTCPQLHIFGAADALVPATVAQVVGALSDADTHVVPDVGHAPHISNPVALATRIHEWLTQCQPNLIDKRTVARSFAAAAAGYDGAAHVQRQVAQQLVVEAGQFTATDQVLDLGCGTGFVSQALQGLSHAPRVYLADLADAMVKHARQKLHNTPGVVGDAEALPFAAESFDAIVSSLALQWCQSLALVGAEAARCLRPNGRFVFSTLGPKTLHELKAAWSELDGYVHVNEFKTAERVREELQQAGLRVRSIRSSPRILHYPELMPLLRELKAIGAHNMNSGRKRGLTRRQQFTRLEQAYHKIAGKGGQLPVTYDVLLVEATKLTDAKGEVHE